MVFAMQKTHSEEIAIKKRSIIGAFLFHRINPQSGYPAMLDTMAATVVALMALTVYCPEAVAGTSLPIPPHSHHRPVVAFGLRILGYLPDSANAHAYGRDAQTKVAPCATNHGRCLRCHTAFV